MRRAAPRAGPAGGDASSPVGIVPTAIRSIPAIVPIAARPLPAAIAAIVTLAGCRGDRPDPVAQSIRTTLVRELDLPVQSVHCRPDRCTATLADGTPIPITVAPPAADRTVAWETPELLDPRLVAARVVGELAALGVTDTADCGPLLIAPPAPTGLTCALGGGGTAWAIVDGDGGIELELAVTAAIALARRTGPGVAALERLSRALDSDEAQGFADDPDGDRDAGATAGDDHDHDHDHPGDDRDPADRAPDDPAAPDLHDAGVDATDAAIRRGAGL